MDKNVELGNVITRDILLLEGNLCNFEGKFIIEIDILVFFL